MRKTIRRIASSFLSFAVALTAAAQFGIVSFAKGNEKAARTILMYFSGANAEDKEASFCSSFLNSVSDCEIPDDVNIIVLTGGAEAWAKAVAGLDPPEERERYAAKVREAGFDIESVSRIIRSALMGSETQSPPQDR